jgi:RimJ/RimL family protein N-acetyltransferase
MMAQLEADFGQELKASDRQRFAIEASEGRLIGYLLYYDLREDIRSASIDLMIGETDYWEGTWGRDAVRLLLEYLFDELGIHRVNCVLSELQDQVRRDLTGIGFRQDGVLRDNEILDGRYIDHHLLSLLEDEYQVARPGSVKGS